MNGRHNEAGEQVIFGKGAMGISCAGGCGALHTFGRRTVRGKGSNIRVTRTYAITGWTCPRCCNKSRVMLAKAKARASAASQRQLEQLEKMRGVLKP
jgi:hypothetical protein